MKPASHRHREDMTSSLQALDNKVHLIERKWGVGKLQQAANTHLLTKFNTQKARLDSAIVDDDPERVIKTASGMERAWDALETNARETFTKPRPAEVWEIKLADGNVVGLVRDQVDASLAVAHGADIVFTLREIGLLIDELGSLTMATKRQFKLAQVTRITKSPQFDERTGDDIPF